jgi:hypothetical protein
MMRLSGGDFPLCVTLSSEFLPHCSLVNYGES